MFKPMPQNNAAALKPDCASCCGLCCVAPAFARSPDFALDKKAGIPCPNLLADFRCSIHHGLRPEGFGGCVAYDCFGAGQKVTQVTFGGATWRNSPNLAGKMFDVYAVMRQLHGLMVYLTEALTLQPPPALEEQLRSKLDEIDHLTYLEPDALIDLVVAPHKAEVHELLNRVSEVVRSPAATTGPR